VQVLCKYNRDGRDKPGHDDFVRYRKLPQKRWMRVQASSSALVAVA
jgi:hypothetical protein